MHLTSPPKFLHRPPHLPSLSKRSRLRTSSSTRFFPPTPVRPTAVAAASPPFKAAHGEWRIGSMDHFLCPCLLRHPQLHPRNRTLSSSMTYRDGTDQKTEPRSGSQCWRTPSMTPPVPLVARQMLVEHVQDAKRVFTRVERSGMRWAFCLACGCSLFAQLRLFRNLIHTLNQNCPPHNLSPSLWVLV